MNTPPVKPVESAETHGSGDNPTAAFEVGADAVLPERIGDYAIVRQLGRGGMGTVYLGEDARLKRQAAIKTMRPELAAKPENRERFRREAQAAAAVEHDNIVPIWQVGEAADGSPFIAMPFLHGEALSARLRRELIAPLPLILKVAREVAEGFGRRSRQGLIHRDIKPENVWLEGDPTAPELAEQVRRCKILDFGLARTAGAEDLHLTASGMILGTPAYMAPEQAAGSDVDQRADLFSLGTLLYRMATGKQPFAGPNLMAVVTALATVTPPSPHSLNPSLPQPLSDLIDRLLSKDPADRPQSAAEVAAAVRKMETPTVGRRRTLLVVVAGLLALVPLVWWLATVLRVETANGTLIVEIKDNEVEARVKGGKLILSDPDGKVRYRLSVSASDTKIEAGPYKIHVEGADGLTLDTPEFTLKKGGEVTVRVTVAKVLDPDREAALWVLSIGGMVAVNEEGRQIKAVAELPQESFRLIGFDLTANMQVSDAGLAYFKDYKNLSALALAGTQVSDAGLANFEGCKNLVSLSLGDTHVSDTGLAYFKDCENLKYLYLSITPVSDAGLANFEGCKNLKELDLRKTKVTAAKVAELRKALPNCKIEWDGP